MTVEIQISYPVHGFVHINKRQCEIVFWTDAAWYVIVSYFAVLTINCNFPELLKHFSVKLSDSVKASSFSKDTKVSALVLFLCIQRFYWHS